jgi:hypothetical protein
MPELQKNGESKIRKVIFNEISFFIAGIGLVSSVMFWVMNPQQKLQIDIVRMQTQLEGNQTVTAALDRIKQNDLNEIQLRLEQIENRQIEILKAVSRLEAFVK